MANTVYNHFKTRLLSGEINLSTADLYLMLCSGAYTFSHNHSVTGDITNEVYSAGYTKGGKLIPSTTVTIDSVDNEAVLDGSDLTFEGLTCSLTYGIVWISGATPSTRYLVGQVDFGAQTLSNSDFVITWNTEGILNLM